MLCNLDFMSRDSVFFDPSDLKSAEPRFISDLLLWSFPARVLKDFLKFILARLFHS